MTANTFKIKQFVIVTLITSIWINASEVFRYFVFVMPRVQNFFNYKEDVAVMDWGIFSIWGLWDTLVTAILVFIFWLYAKTFGFTIKSAVTAGVITWVAIFVVFWVATANMGLSEWKSLLVILPLCLLEMLVGAWIALKLYSRK